MKANTLMLLVILFILILQALMGMLQVKRYRAFMGKLVGKYRGIPGYDLYSDVSNKGFIRTLLIAIIDGDGRVVDCYLCRGISVFARYRRAEDLIGLRLEDVADKVQASSPKDIVATERLLANIHVRRMKKAAQGAL